MLVRSPGRLRSALKASNLGRGKLDWEPSRECVVHTLGEQAVPTLKHDVIALKGYRLGGCFGCPCHQWVGRSVCVEGQVHYLRSQLSQHGDDPPPSRDAWCRDRQDPAQLGRHVGLQLSLRDADRVSRNALARLQRDVHGRAWAGTPTRRAGDVEVLRTIVLGVTPNLEGNDSTGQVANGYDQAGGTPEAQVLAALARVDLQSGDRQQQVLRESGQELPGNLRSTALEEAAVPPVLDRRRVQAPSEELLPVTVRQPEVPDRCPVHTVE